MSRTFVVTNQALAEILGDPTATSVVDQPGNVVHEIDQIGQTPNTLTHATLIPTMTVQDVLTQQSTGGTGTFYALKQQLNAGLPSWCKAILVDLEAWTLDGTNANIPQTRTVQQANPVWWYRLAGRMVRSRGLIALASPSRSLAGVTTAPAGGLDAATIASNIYGLTASAFDGVVVQGQNDQPAGPGYTLPPTAYENFVQPCIAQIQAAAPHTKILCGLAVHTADVSPYTNLQAMIAACGAYTIGQGAVGWWLNFNNAAAAGIAMTQALAGV